jgi:hypothetical protein
VVCKQGSAKQMQITTINNLARSWSLAMEEVEHQESGRKNLSQPLESLQGLLDGSSLQSFLSSCRYQDWRGTPGGSSQGNQPWVQWA